VVCRICGGNHQKSDCQFEKGVTTETEYIPTAYERTTLPKIGGLDVNKALRAFEDDAEDGDREDRDDKDGGLG
jgi:hypothetical protein